MTRFIHIADIHHARYDDTNILVEHSSFDIQRDKLNQLAHVIHTESIQAVLVAGDIEVSDPNDFLPYLRDWTRLGASVYIIFGDHDVHRAVYTDVWETVENVHCFLEPGYVFDARLGAGIYGLSCEARRIGLSESFVTVPQRRDAYPNLFLTHGNRTDFPKDVIASLGYDYYALGHLHEHKQPFTRGGVPFVYPGHVFSVWDGSGKAWTTGYVIGTISPDGVTHEFRPFEGPETRRIAFNRFDRNEDRIRLSLDNIAWDNDGWVTDDDSVMRFLVCAILTRYPDDYFVTPSDRSQNVTRVCMTGRTLLRNEIRFEDFYRRSFKATATTQ
ncbi:hypothetical protein EVJ32_11480 [Exiguobacterium sp. SH5S4]|uniref:metallophosphoesterase family protein n=1 Tax=Exiguobacterium sp. SH5S4 TaxID=2510961 RepID=UPI00103ED5C3|nr:metallophosphoesterase family protein [Exiguobacterium sp. SH5S4]TCI25116.1 hypothetical protein EVJ32_11480 [Exiguobacterium sp. SH5S4]